MTRPDIYYTSTCKTFHSDNMHLRDGQLLDG